MLLRFIDFTYYMLKVANFEYIDGVKPAEEVAQNEAKENQFSAESLKIIIYWEGLLKKAYEQCQVEKLNALGKGKRTRTKWVVCHARIFAANKCINLRENIFFLFELCISVFILLMISPIPL